MYQFLYAQKPPQQRNVQHQVFGKGTVLEVDGDNATIYFKGKGAKKLNLSFAPIEKCE